MPTSKTCLRISYDCHVHAGSELISNSRAPGHSHTETHDTNVYLPHSPYQTSSQSLTFCRLVQTQQGNLRHRTPSRSGAAPWRVSLYVSMTVLQYRMLALWWVTMSIRPFRVAHSWPLGLYANVTSSTNRKYITFHNVARGGPSHGRG